MTRPLLLIAGCGFVAALVSFFIAFALGPVGHDWDWEMMAHGPGRGPAIVGGGPTVTRELVWNGGESLSVNVPAIVTYTQAPATKVTVTGPQSAVDHLEFDGDTLRFDRRVRRPGRLQVTISAPGVQEFTLNGSQRLTVEDYDQERLSVTVNGSGDAVARGRARVVELQIAGSGDVDLGGVEAEEGEVHIAGSGKAILSPKRSAEIRIAGSGDVILTTRPPRVEQHIVGSGRIVQGQAGEKPAAAPGPDGPASARQAT